MNLLKKLWKLLNSPIIVVAIALSIWPVFTALTAQYAISKLTSQTINAISNAFHTLDENKSDEIGSFLAIKENVNFSNVNYTFSDWPTKEKLVATITNDSNQPLNEIMLNVSFYDAQDNLIDVQDNTWLSNIKILQPGESHNFSIKRSLGTIQATDEEVSERRSNRVEIHLSSAKEFKI
ncbi:FxLYD domain-containing protein [Desulfoluna butyratoxydans]|uniref:Uncharacterized protein n=1 Tax=Desulfoluna butyratoxydans TaxID=231438 RepID=A0A4U8YHP8_9BACT|nr:FxLYD domain-containing protein [Desulfoluna butyratoxydans]VFQ42800.1 hypothetical protein MSL71_4210 [Desulfoluna butyratoxydans]